MKDSLYLKEKVMSISPVQRKTTMPTSFIQRKITMSLPRSGTALRKLVDFMSKHPRLFGADELARLTQLPKVTVSNAFKSGYIYKLKGLYFYLPSHPSDLQKIFDQYAR